MHAAGLDPEHLYNEHFGPLVELALSNRVAIEEAEQLAHDVLLSSLAHLPRIANLEAWLVGSLRCAIAGRNPGV